MKSILQIYKVKPEGLSKIKQLINDLVERKKESIETLEEAGISVESLFLHGNMLYVFKLAKDLDLMKQAQAQSTHPLYNLIRPVTTEYLEPHIEIFQGADFVRNIN